METINTTRDPEYLTTIAGMLSPGEMDHMQKHSLVNADITQKNRQQQHDFKQAQLERIPALLAFGERIMLTCRMCDQIFDKLKKEGVLK